MNVYQRLINILAETVNPEYWSIHELIYYLKLSQNEFAKQSRITRKNSCLAQAIEKVTDGQDIEFIDGEYCFPTDCLDVLSVQWNGKPLDQKSLTYLETAYSGTSSQEVLRGSGRIMESGWRSIKGFPNHWIHDRNVRIFPLTKEEPTVTVLATTNAILNSNKFAVNSSKGMQYVVRFNTIVTENNESYTGQSIFWRLEPEKYAFFTKNNQLYLSLDTKYLSLIRDAIANDRTVELLCYPLSDSVTMDYIYKPAFKALEPYQVEQEGFVVLGLSEQWHEAVVCYAAYLALSKEGDKTQDLSKATIYQQRFQEYIEQAKSVAEGEIDIDPFVELPFVI